MNNNWSIIKGIKINTIDTSLHLQHNYKNFKNNQFTVNITNIHLNIERIINYECKNIQYKETNNDNCKWLVV